MVCGGYSTLTSAAVRVFADRRFGRGSVATVQQVEASVVLGLDTSTRAGGIALVQGGRVLAGLDVLGSLDHSERLVPAVDFLLGRLALGVGDLAGVAVAVGPGSFTGVRVGLATARGLARAAGIRATGVITLEALARCRPVPPEGTWVCPWIDAGRGEVYAAAWESRDGDLVERVAPSVSRPEAWLRSLPPGVRARFRGDGAEAWDALLREGRGGGELEGPGPWFLARTVARLGEIRLRAASPPPALPLYLRASDAARAGRAGR
jgi:tRNA threonylcarbamoyladenosine biosynthesis protein TsaB